MYLHNYNVNLKKRNSTRSQVSNYLFGSMEYNIPTIIKNDAFNSPFDIRYYLFPEHRPNSMGLFIWGYEGCLESIYITSRHLGSKSPFTINLIQYAFLLCRRRRRLAHLRRLRLRLRKRVKHTKSRKIRRRCVRRIRRVTRRRRRCIVRCRRLKR